VCALFTLWDVGLHMRFKLTSLIFALAFGQAVAQPTGVVRIVGGMNGDVEIPVGVATTSISNLSLGEASSPDRAQVAFETQLSPGTILVRTKERKLYFILPNSQAIAYKVGVGREGFAWSGTNTISRKAEWPDWRPPPEMIKRELAVGHVIPAMMPGGPKNPLGARALYLGDTDFRIHGTDKPWSIGHAVSSGCIRMLNDHVAELYNLVQVGTKVIVE
jgi:lipoprotein-anchoring transpeptidase ErfK/SrfK